MCARILNILLPWIVCGLLIPAVVGIDSAFADTGPLPETGGIAGGLFMNTAALPAKMAALPPALPPTLPSALPAAMPANPGPDLCGPAVAQASAGHNLPPGLLHAIAMVESGRLNPQTGNEKPWPWTIDADGAGYMYPSEQAAEQAAAGFEAAGITSLDIGCLQVNLAQHPDAFQTLAQAFDPAANANYAAAFLTSLEQKFGNWPQAVAAYHSQTPALGGPYAARVYAQWQGAGAGTVALAEAGMPNAPPAAPAAVPPLPSAFQMTSLMPPGQIMQRSQPGMTGRSLASYRAAPVAIATSLAPAG